MRYFVASGEDRRLDPATRKQLRGSFIELPSGITHYELSGPAQGRVVVLVGGLTIPLFYWDEVLPALHARGLRTLTYSLYGRGYSDRVAGAYDEAFFVRQLTELTDALDLGEGRHLVGTSMGALIAMAFLNRHPESMSTLSLIGPAGLGPRSPLQQALFRSNVLTTLVAKHFGQRILARHLGHNVSDPRRAGDLAEMVRPCYRYRGSMYSLFAALRNFELHDRVELYERTGRLDVPKLLMWGTDDRVTPISSLDDVRRMLRPAECRVFQDCGHMAPYERPAEVGDQLAEFLTSA